MKKSILLLTIYAIVIAFIFSRCANMATPPSGGPKDTIPPVVLKSTPMDGEVGFTGSRFNVVLNEYPKLKEPQKQFIMSPPLEVSPYIRTNGKSVQVVIEEELKPNTTYILDFGNSITDLNEGNVLEGFRVRFSTGEKIDSGRIKGRVQNAFTCEPAEDVTVFLYENDIDSLPLTVVPNAIARASKRGFFIADGLKEGHSYKVVAVTDKNQDNKYQPGIEDIGFLPTLLTATDIAGDTTSIVTLEKDSTSTFSDLTTLRLFNENTSKQFLESYKREEERKVVLCFKQRHPEIVSLRFEGVDSTDIIREETYWRDTLTYWFTSDTVPKNLRAEITYIRPDSLGVPAPFTAQLKFDDLKKGSEEKNKSEERSAPSIKLDVQVDNDLVTEKGILLKLAAPLSLLDSTKVRLYKYKSVTDSLKNEIPFSIKPHPQGLCYYHIDAELESSNAYELAIDSLAMTDIYKQHNAALTKRIETPNESKYSTLTFELSNVSGVYIIQLVKSKHIVQERVVRSNGALKFSFLSPGDYSARIIHDINANNRWDTGCYLERLQPEPVAFMKQEGVEAISLKQNWDHNLTVDINALFGNRPKEAEKED